MLGAALILAATPISLRAQPQAGAQNSNQEGAAEPAWIAFEGHGEDPIIIPVTLGGVDAQALIDTGSAGVILDRAQATALKLDLKPIPSLNGLSGKVPAAQGRLPFMQAGLFKGTDIWVDVTDLGQTAPLTGLSFKAILGARFFTWAAMQVDFDRSALRFLPTGAATGGTAVADVIYDPNTGQIFTNLEINGKRLDRVVISTGQGDGLRVSTKAWARVGPKTARMTDLATADLRGVSVNTYAIMPELSFGGQTVHDIPTIIDPEGGLLDTNKASASIGLDLLRHFNLVLDVQQGKLFLAQRQSPEVRAPKSTSGLQAIYGPKGLQVIHVMRHSPAELAGLKDGDLICEVDHAKVDPSWSNNRMGAWSVAAPGRKVELSLCGGGAKTMTLSNFY
jgi:hypothetical protein